MVIEKKNNPKLYPFLNFAYKNHVAWKNMSEKNCLLHVTCTHTKKIIVLTPKYCFALSAKINWLLTK